MKILSPNEQRTLQHRYNNSDLNRQWLPILAMLQRNYGEADAQTLWLEAELQIVRLRSEDSFREQEMSLIYNDLLLDCAKFNNTPRTKKQAQQTASIIMCIVLTMLMNAVEKGHEDEFFANEPMCMAILDILAGDVFSQNLMQLFFRRNIGYDGKRVVIAPKDPMVENTLLEDMDEFAREETNKLLEKVLKYTKRLKGLFGEYWEAWRPLWTEICMDYQLLHLLQKIEPRTTDWEMNEKMICNVIGMFRDRTIKSTVSITIINNTLYEKNVRSYLSKHADYDGTNSVFDKEQHDKIEKMIDKHILSIKRN